MIVRIWHGATPAEKADAYLDYLHATGLNDYRAIAGNRGVRALHRVAGERADFLLLSFRDSLDAVRSFAGPDIERAVYYPEDTNFLLELEPRVTHYEVVADL